MTSCCSCCCSMRFCNNICHPQRTTTRRRRRRLLTPSRAKSRTLLPTFARPSLRDLPNSDGFTVLIGGADVRPSVVCHVHLSVRNQPPFQEEGIDLRTRIPREELRFPTAATHASERHSTLRRINVVGLLRGWAYCAMTRFARHAVMNALL